MYVTTDELKLQMVAAMGGALALDGLRTAVALGHVSPREALAAMKALPISPALRAAIERGERWLHHQEKGTPVYLLVIFDADGTLRRSTVRGQPCPNRSGESQPMVDVFREVRSRLEGMPSKVNYGIASNQGGISKGVVSAETAHSLLLELYGSSFGRFPLDGVIAICPHHPGVTGPCGCRKPAPGMLRSIMSSRCVRADETLFVGDMATDLHAAQAAGVDFRYAWDFFGVEKERWMAAIGEDDFAR